MNSKIKSLTLFGVMFTLISGANAGCSGSGFTVALGGGMANLGASIDINDKVKTKSTKTKEIKKLIKEKVQAEANNLKKENRKTSKNNVPVVATKPGVQVNANNNQVTVYDYSCKGEFAADQYTDATGTLQAYTIVKDAKYVEPVAKGNYNQFYSNQTIYEREKQNGNQSVLVGPALVTTDKQFVSNETIYVPKDNKITIALPSGPAVKEFKELVSDKGYTKDGKEQTIVKDHVGEPVRQFFGVARDDNMYMLSKITANSNYTTMSALWTTFYNGNADNQKLLFDKTNMQQFSYANNPWEISQLKAIKEVTATYFVDGDKLGSYFVESIDKSFADSADSVSNFANTKKWGFYAGLDLGYTVRIADFYVNPYGTANYTKADIKVGDSKEDKDKSTGNPELSSGLGFGLGIKCGYNITQSISIGILAEYVWTQYKLKMGENFVNGLKITDNNLITFANNLYKIDNKSTIASEISKFNSDIDNYKLGEEQKAWVGAFGAGAFFRFDINKNIFVALQGKYMFKHNVTKSVFDGNLNTPVQGLKVGVQVGFVF